MDTLVVAYCVLREMTLDGLCFVAAVLRQLERTKGTKGTQMWCCWF